MTVSISKLNIPLRGFASVSTTYAKARKSCTVLFNAHCKIGRSYARATAKNTSFETAMYLKTQASKTELELIYVT